MQEVNTFPFLYSDLFMLRILILITIIIALLAYGWTTYNRWAVLTNCPKFDDYLYISICFDLKLCIYTVLTILLLSHIGIMPSMHWCFHGCRFILMFLPFKFQSYFTLHKLQGNKFLPYDYSSFKDFSIS